MKKTAVVLFNFGGPSNLAAVKPFLFRFFSDPAIIPLFQPLRFLVAKLISTLRAPYSSKNYASIGGKSPILKFTIAQSERLEQMLNEKSKNENYKTFIAMRYEEPRVREAIMAIKNYQPEKVILLPLYPQFSSTTTLSSIKDFYEQLNQISRPRRLRNWLATLGDIDETEQKKVELKLICCYPNDPDLAAAHALLIQKTIEKFKDLSQLRFLFSAHGLPERIIAAGDPYAFQIGLSAEAVVGVLAKLLKVKRANIDYRVCYQSRVGSAAWTSPYLELELKKAVLDDKIPVMIPISFVCDNLETLYDLDIVYKNLSTKLGIKRYLRTPALNQSEPFIKGLAAICHKANATKNKPGNDWLCLAGRNSGRICDSSMKKCPNLLT